MVNFKILKSIKKKSIKGLAFALTLSTALGLVAPVNSLAAFKYKNYNLDTVISYKGIQPVYIIDNERMDKIRPAIIDNSNGAAMCGANEVFRDCIGADVVYKKSKGTVTFKYNNHELVVSLNSKVGKLDGKEVALPNAPFRMKYWDGTLDTFVPSKFVATALGLSYEWNATDNTISIKRPHIIYINGERNEYYGTLGKITLDGESIRLKKTPSYVRSDTAMLNAKKVIGQIDDAQYYYDKKSGYILITAGDVKLEMRVGERNVYRNGVIECASLAPVKIYDEEFDMEGIYIPGRYLFNALGMDYEWVDADKTSKITTTANYGHFTPKEDLYAIINSNGKIPALDELEQELSIPLPEGYNETPVITEDYYNNCIIIDLKGNYAEYYMPYDLSNPDNKKKIEYYTGVESSTKEDSDSNNSGKETTKTTKDDNNVDELVVADNDEKTEVADNSKKTNDTENSDINDNSEYDPEALFTDRFQLVGNAIQQAQVYYLKDKDTTRIKLYTYCYPDEVFPGSIVEFSDNSVNFKFDMPKDLYDKIIVLDAGHGDNDPGTVHGGYNEKDFNFDIVCNMCRSLFDESDVKVYYTRSDDSLIPLLQRADLAKHVQADFFIAVHQNSSSNTSVKGTSVYYSPTNTGKVDFNGYTGKKIAEMLLTSITNKLETKNFGLGSTEFSVTKYNSVPAVLIECGFMSNPDELQLLAKSKTHKSIAQCIFNVVNKIYKNPLK